MAQVPEVKQLGNYIEHLFLFIARKEESGPNLKESTKDQLQMMSYIFKNFSDWINMVISSWGDDRTSDITPELVLRWKNMTNYDSHQDYVYLDKLKEIDIRSATNRIQDVESKQIIQKMIVPTVKATKLTPTKEQKVAKDAEKSKKAKDSSIEEAKKTKPEGVHTLPTLPIAELTRVKHTAYNIIQEGIFSIDPNVMPTNFTKNVVEFYQHWYQNKMMKYIKTCKQLYGSDFVPRYVSPEHIPTLFAEVVAYLADQPSGEDIDKAFDSLYASVDCLDKNWKYVLPYSVSEYGMMPEKKTMSPSAIAVWRILYDNVFAKINDRLVNNFDANVYNSLKFNENEIELMFAHNISAKASSVDDAKMTWFKKRICSESSVLGAYTRVGDSN